MGESSYSGGEDDVLGARGAEEGERGDRRDPEEDREGGEEGGGSSSAGQVGIVPVVSTENCITPKKKQGLGDFEVWPNPFAIVQVSFLYPLTTDLP